MPEPRVWTCASCQSEQTHEVICQACYAVRFSHYDVQLSEHVLEHIADGLATPLEIQKAMNERPCYARIAGGFQLQFIAQRIRLLTKDTTKLASDLARAMSASAMLRVFKDGEPNVLLQALTKYGPKTNAEQHEHKGEVQTIVKHVYEDGTKRDA